MPLPLRVSLRPVLFFVLLAAFTGAAYGQASIFQVLYGYTPLPLNGAGFGGNLRPAVQDIGQGNPALLATFLSPAAGVAFQYGTSSPWLENITMDPGNAVIPQAAGVVYPSGAWRFGMGLGQVYSTHMEARAGDRGTAEFEFPGEEETYSMEETGRVLLMGPVVAYEAAFGAHHVAGGGRLQWARASLHSSISNSEIRRALHGIVWSLGGRYAFQRDEASQLRLEAFFESRIHAETTIRPESGVDINRDPGAGGPTSYIVVREWDVAADLPARLSLQAAATASQLEVQVGVSRVFWRTLDSERYVDNTELSFAVLYDVTGHVSASVSYFDTQRGRMYREAPYFFSSHENKYIAVGSIVQVGPIRLDLVIADSHAFSAERYQHTLFRLGASYTL